MKVLEVKNNLVKISYNVDDNLALSGFVVIEDVNMPYVAQVMNLKSDLSGNYAIVKLLFTFNNDGILKNYNGTIPSTNAIVTKLASNELFDILQIDNPLYLGVLAQQDISFKVDSSILENNLLICSNNLANTKDLLACLTSQIKDAKSVIIDTEGQFESDDKIEFGKDFKLPLDADTIDYIYETDLEDVSAINKAVIQDILIEVQNYINTLPEKFIPIDNFINVVDLQYKDTQIPELILLKNKLLKYKSMNVFAQDIKEIYDLSIKIDKSQLTTIDISTVPSEVQKEVLRYIYSVLNDVESKIYAFTKVNNSNITKRLLKRFISKTNVFTTVICPHEFKYIEEIKEVAQNIIFFAPSTLTHDFASYNTFLSKLNDDEFVVYGAHTQNIPMIVQVTDEIVEDNTETQNSSANPFYNRPNPFESNDEEGGFDEFEQNNSFEDESNDTSAELIDDAEDEKQEVENVEETEVIEEVSEPEIVEATDDNQEISDSEENVIEPLKSNEDSYPTEDFAESDETLAGDDYIVPVSVVEDENVNEVQSVEETTTTSENDNLEEQIAEDVERSFYKKIPQDDEFNSTPEIVEDSITEDDLNLIDDLAADDVPLAGDNYTDEVPMEEEEIPPVVPIYPADDIEERENGVFESGDRVITEKFGEGIVEKMIKYGNKMLCSIEFPEIGRRLLDPNVTDIKRID